MKSFFVLCSLAVSVLGQAAFITVPSEGQTLTAGQAFTITVEKPVCALVIYALFCPYLDFISSNFQDALTGSTDIGIGISLAHCQQDPCESHLGGLGFTLFAGGYDPVRAPNTTQQPTQNFTVTIPSGFQSGLAVMSLEHAYLLGVCNF